MLWNAPMAASSLTARDRIIEIARTLPPAPKVLAGLGKLLRDPNSGVGQISEMIKRDAPLASQIIRISNSVVYAGSASVRIGAIEDAVGRVGYEEIHRLVSCVTAERLVDRALTFYGIPAETMRENMLYTALTCEALAREAGMDPREAYTAGLMRTLGILVLDRLAERLGVAARYDPEHDEAYRVWEGRIFGLGNCAIAGIILAEWSFPAEIVAAVRDHHLAGEPDRAERLACLLHLASAIVAGTNHGLPGERQLWNFSPETFAAVGLNFRQIDSAGRSALKAFEAFYLRYRMSVEPPPSQPGGPGAEADAPPPQKTCDSRAAPGVLDENESNPVQTTEEAPEAPGDFTTFMRNYKDMVYSTAVRLLGNETQAEDISQEVFLKAFEHWDNLRESVTAGGWLKTVTTNLSINHLQRYRKRWRFFSEITRHGGADEGDEQPVEFASSDNFLDGLNQSDRRAWVERALEKLPEHQRVPLVLYHFEDQPYEDIAKRLGVTLSKVKTDIMRGREALAKVLLRSGASHEQFEA